MTNVVLVLALLVQDPDVVLSGRAGRQDKEYELALSGKGRGLRDAEFASLRFRLRANRMDWNDGSITTVTLEDETLRLAPVEQGAFQHRERFAAPAEVEVRIALRHAGEEAASGTPWERVFRTASLPEEAYAIGGAAKRFDAAMRMARLLKEDLESAAQESCPSGRRESKLQARIERRLAMLHTELADPFLSAASQAASLWLSDIKNAWALVRSGKPLSGMLSSIDGAAFDWGSAADRLDALDALSVRERALLVVRCAAAISREASSAARPRLEKELNRSLETLLQVDGDFRSSPEYVVAALDVDLLLGQTQALLQTAPDADLSALSREASERAATLEARIRAPQ